MIPLKENILEQQDKLHDVKVECFTKIQKLVEKLKALEKYLEIVSRINLKMESLKTKIGELDKWRNMEKNVPSVLPTFKTYDIRLHILAMKECQETTSKFEEKSRQRLARIMEVYEKSIYDVQRYLQWPEINLRDEHLVFFSFFQELKDIYEMIKAEVQVKEVISKEDIQEFLVKSSIKFSHYTSFEHKFVVDMEKFKECNLSLDVKKVHIFKSREKRILTQHEA